MDEVKATVLIKGKVQGVFFRAYTQETAQELGLKGWVRNLPLRRVEAVFQGPRDQVEKAIAWCHQGSPSALVTEVDVSWSEPDPALAGFEIRY
ncbi:MAG: acylphosphatase [Desulfarculus sp.]|nr:acylphosphatase [Desulfarculus sp.]